MIDPDRPNGRKERKIGLFIANLLTHVTVEQAAAAASVESVERLREILRDGETQSLQLTAAKTILEMALRAAELGDLEERLAKLETIAQGRGWRIDEPSHAAPKGVNGHA